MENSITYVAMDTHKKQHRVALVQLNKANTFDYLTELQKHIGELSSKPDSWMPWNYQNVLQRTNTL